MYKYILFAFLKHILMYNIITNLTFYFVDHIRGLLVQFFGTYGLLEILSQFDSKQPLQICTHFVSL